MNQSSKLVGWRTVAVAGMNLAAVAIPETRQIIQGNPELYGAILSLLMIALRRITKTPIGSNQLPLERTAFQIARDEIGQKEYSGEADNPRVVEYLKSVRNLSSTAQRNDETPWCSAFVNWAMKNAGIKGTDSAAARSWLNWGVATEKPKPGDLVVFWRGSRDGWQGHVGFFDSMQGNNVFVIGGNQDNEVNRKAYPVDRVIGYRTYVGIGPNPVGPVPDRGEIRKSPYKKR